MKFGDKVICKGYLKNVKTKYVYANDKHFEESNKETPEDYKEEAKKECLFINNDYEISQTTKETRMCNKPFKGLIIGKGMVSTTNWYTQVERDIFDPVSYGYVDSVPINKVKVEKTGYIECYLVAYGMDKTRQTPVNLVEDMEMSK